MWRLARRALAARLIAGALIVTAGLATATVARLVLGGFLAAPGLASAGAAEAHYVKLKGEFARPGALTAGVALSGRPFAYLDDGMLRGFEVAMAEAVAAALGLELALVRLPRSRLAKALAAGDIDVANTLAVEAPIADTATVPYLVVGDHVMVVRGNPYRIATTADLAGRIVAVTAGSSAEAFARALDGELAAAGAAPMTIHSFPDQRYTHYPVSMGHAAAYFARTISAVAVSQDPAARTRLLEGAFRPRREVGFAVRADRANIHHGVESAVAAMVATGKYARLSRDYGLPPELSPFR